MLLASRFALIVIESREEARVLQLVREASFKVSRGRAWGVFQWTVTEGLRRVDRDLRHGRTPPGSRDWAHYIGLRFPTEAIGPSRRLERIDYRNRSFDNSAAAILISGSAPRSEDSWRT